MIFFFFFFFFPSLLLLLYFNFVYSLVLRTQHVSHAHHANDNHHNVDECKKPDMMTDINSNTTPQGSHFVIDASDPSSVTNTESPNTGRSKKVSFVDTKGKFPPHFQGHDTPDRAYADSTKVSPARRRSKRSLSESPQLERHRMAQSGGDRVSDKEGARRVQRLSLDVNAMSTQSSQNSSRQSVQRLLDVNDTSTQSSQNSSRQSSKESLEAVPKQGLNESRSFSVSSRTRLLSSCSEKDFSDC